MGKNDLRAARLRTLLIWLVASGFALALCTGLYFRAARELQQNFAEREAVRVGLFARLFGGGFSGRRR